MKDNDAKRHDVIVVGGGQAGLAIGYFLAAQGRDFTILEAAAEPAAAWRERWDSLKLFTPARYNALPGRAFPGDPDSYPGRDDVVAYLTEYARDFDLPSSSGVASVLSGRLRTATWSSSMTARTRRTRSWSRPVPSRFHSCRR
jgi:putative flavoprotein involved in K+ transport